MGGNTRIEMDYMNSVCSINRKMKDQKKPDWEQRRYEIAKENMPFLLWQEQGNFERAAKYAVKSADALIEELKKGGTDGKVG